MFFTTMKIRGAVSCVATLFSVLVAYHPEDGSSNVLRNVDILPHTYMASQQPKEAVMYFKTTIRKFS
jgi:hypothetical protein